MIDAEYLRSNLDIIPPRSLKSRRRLPNLIASSKQLSVLTTARPNNMISEGAQTPSRHPYLLHQQAGERALQDKQYRSAKHALDLAWQGASHDLNKNSLSLISILDLRVEVEIRRRNFPPAVKDAHNMVKLDRTDPRGYLRCGQLSTLEQDLAGAQKWYQRGLSNVPKTHDSYDKLASMSLKTTSKLSLKTTTTRATIQKNKSADPFSVLPMELIQMVLKHLEYREATSCLRVSRSWRSTLLATHSIWKTLDLQGPKPVTLRHLKACIRRLPNPPTTIRLDRLNQPAIEYLRSYLERWRATEHMSINLKELRDLTHVSSAANTLKSLHVGESCKVGIWLLDEVLHSCLGLQKAQFDHIIIRGERPPRNHPILPSLQNRMRVEMTHLVLNVKDVEPDEDRRFTYPGSLLEIPVSQISMPCVHQLIFKVWLPLQLPKPSNTTL
jgi:F-box-like